MQLTKDNQLFNFFNTNGRRSDFINALTIYMNILNEDFESGGYTWESFPNGLGQFHFYERALEMSKGTFNKFTNYDFIKSKLKDQRYHEAFYSLDKEALDEINDDDLKKFKKILDNGVEIRSRHYTSTLLKIGFIFNDRKISPAGKVFLGDMQPIINDFEKLLPIDKVNLILLRQALKVRVYTKDYNYYYSPTMLLLYALVQNERMDVDRLFGLINNITPYYPLNFEELNKAIKKGCNDKFISNYEKNFIKIDFDETVPFSEEKFNSIFLSRKSSKDQHVYFEFYKVLFNFVKKPNEVTYNKLKLLFENNDKKKILNNNFGESNNFLNFRVKDFKEFILENQDSGLLDFLNFNSNFYLKFFFSKRRKNIRENSDTFLRLVRATGIFEIKNNIIRLAHRDLWVEYLKEVDFSQLIFNKSNSIDGEFYEKNNASPFYKANTLNYILGISKEQMKKSIIRVQQELGVYSFKELQENVINSNNELFKDFIKQNFPLKEVTAILDMFKDRKNDKKIKEKVGINETSIPTIYEYMIGIAWYYLSDEEYDVFSSFNLTMNANFLPETHAGGGVGDIVIHYKNHTLMLEVTLMNKNAQKRGEWEPVLRHATNLTIEQHPNRVRTLFIADELDQNTINIWRAVASVPMKSTSGSNKYAQSVVIMPLTTSELISFIEDKVSDEKIYNEIDQSYNQLPRNFDMSWRQNIINSI